MKEIILMIFGAVVLIIILLTLLSKLRGKGKKILNEIQLEIQNSNETIILPPQGATFNGADKEYGSIKCTGVIASTEKRIIFKPLIGKTIEINFNLKPHRSKR